MPCTGLLISEAPICNIKQLIPTSRDLEKVVSLMRHSLAIRLNLGTSPKEYWVTATSWLHAHHWPRMKTDSRKYSSLRATTLKASSLLMLSSEADPHNLLLMTTYPWISDHRNWLFPEVHLMVAFGDPFWKKYGLR